MFVVIRRCGVGVAPGWVTGNRSGAIMSLTGLASLDTSVHATNTWIKDLAEELGWADAGGRQRAYHALRAVLHALRDRLPVGEVADLAAQLPLILRGVYYEGWRPAASVANSAKDHNKAQFVGHVAMQMDGAMTGGDVEDLVRAVFRVLARHVSGGEVDDVRNSMPARLRDLWD
jgi:uncharacterized protein (DUF2267 family)